MFKVKLNKTLSLLWLAAVGTLLVSVNFKGNALWNNVIFITFLALMVLAIWKHYALKPKPPQVPIPVPQETAEPVEQESTVILILGPYAEKWFSNPESPDSTRFSSHAVWILITNPAALQKRLTYIAEHHPSAQVLTFFPFLPDVYENAAVMMSKLTVWQNTFSTLSLRSPLPCVLAIYAQLSNERLSHNSDNAYWTGNINLANQQPIEITQALQSLSQRLELQDINHSGFATQRNVMAHNLFTWLNESGVTNLLQSIFSRPPLRLTDVILSDNGKGFIRHGAWSAWLEKKFGIIPSLASTLSLPPFPAVINDQKPAIKPRVKTPVIKPIPASRGWLWSVCFAAVLLASHMLNTLWQEKDRHAQFNQQMVPLDNINDFSAQYLARSITQLTDEGKTLTTCVNTFDVTRWGLSQCQTLLSQINRRIESYENIPVFSFAQKLPLFDSNSTKLKLNSQTNEMMMELLSLVEKNKGKKILIVGHSDNTGSSSMNMTLSEQRALALRDWLIKRSDITVDNFITKGMGASEPVATNHTEAGREQNRRVEVLILPTQDRTRMTEPKPL
ncbi:OmpA family protein [Yersinia pseudotuberculosis]|uniref:OmpA family protein n=1 Tax=Yersinia pseudotuberculosis TaxID=633 RepID=A0ABM7AIZ2_YERPU|nr:OmpA family protein [Yersinia pseudotuberculosis]AYW92561.1 OmpA family protein [Yersinia pseudotuberculosis]